MSLASKSIKFQLTVIGKHVRGWSPLVTGADVFDRPGSGYLAHGLRIKKSDGAAREVLDLFVDEDNLWQLDIHQLGGDGKWFLIEDSLGFDWRGPLTTNSDAEDVLRTLKLGVMRRL